MWTYAIADMHGRLDLWEKAVEVIREHCAFYSWPCEIVVMGDFIDRGPDAAGLIRALRTFENKPALSLRVLRGNHEDMMLEVLADFTPHNWQWWGGNGGVATLKSYGYQQGDPVRPYKSPLAQDMHWLRSLPYYYETEKQVFVHAAVLPDLPMDQQPPAILTWECWDKNWQPPWDDEEGGQHRDAVYPKHVVHGHEQWAKGPILLDGRTDLDTFAWYTGRLAIGVFDDTQGKPIDILWAIGEPHGGS